VIEIPAGGHLMDAAFDLPFLPGFNIEGFPNRDSTIYGDLYGIDSVHTLVRGTIRYKVSTLKARKTFNVKFCLHPGIHRCHAWPC
jgi:hypothetical protein